MLCFILAKMTTVAPIKTKNKYKIFLLIASLSAVHIVHKYTFYFILSYSTRRENFVFFCASLGNKMKIFLLLFLRAAPPHGRDR